MIPAPDPDRLPLPRMRTFDEAVAVSKQSSDYFFLCAFMLPIVHRVEPHWCWSIYNLENYRRDNLGLPDLESCDRQLPVPPAGLALATAICPPEPVT